MKYSIKDFLSSKIALEVSKKDRPEFNRLMDEAGMKWGCGHEASKHDWFPCLAENKVLCWSRGGLPVVEFSDLAPVTPTPADFFAGRIGCRCETRAEYDALMRECEGKGLVWCGGDSPTKYTPSCGVPLAIQVWQDHKLTYNYPCSIDMEDLPFSAIFPADPWAEFCAGKCYMRVKKEEWVEFAKRCIEAGMRWKCSGPIQPVGYRGGLGGDGDYFTQGDGKFLDGYDINTRADMPRYDFSALLPAPAKAPEPPATHPVKVGDRIRIKMDNACSAEVCKGDVLTVAKVRDNRGGITTGGLHAWMFRAEDYEIIPATPPAPYDGRGKHKVGDLFEVIFAGDVFNVGDIIRLRYDDGSKCPSFERLSDGETGCKFWGRIKPHTPPTPAPRIEITVAGRVTTATLYEDGKAVRTGTATCSPEDEFEFFTGATIAYNRVRFGQQFQPTKFAEFMALSKKIKALGAEIEKQVGKL